MTPYLKDADVTLYHGDVLDVLGEMEAESVDCCVTSPPYWGLRDYGTGAWEGGNEGCDHTGRKTIGDVTESNAEGQRFRNSPRYSHQDEAATATTCGKCGATRIDQQLGLEPTPEQYVERMVEVFREVRRVLAPHGTVWLNLGDSYAGGGRGGHGGLANLDRWGEFKPPQGDGNEYPRSYRASEHSRWCMAVPQVGVPIGKCDCEVSRSLKPKDLVGIPWRVAFALQADGWYLRSDIIWAKPNPMPESVTDRPTKAHEYVFLLSKQPRYFFDAEAVREKAQYGFSEATGQTFGRARLAAPTDARDTPIGTVTPGNGAGGRNIRSVWEIATQPYPEAHFATFPEELARRCIAAGCPEQVCRVCGKARGRVVERGNLTPGDGNHVAPYTWSRSDARKTLDPADMATARALAGHIPGAYRPVLSEGWSDCGHSDYRSGVTLDPFVGSGTVCHVARKLGRCSVGIDLSAEYLDLAARRLQQQSLFALDNGAERSPSAERAELEPVPTRRRDGGRRA